MILYLLILILFVYAVFKERQALGCKNYIWEGIDCDNANGKAVCGTAPEETDTQLDTVSKIKYAVAFPDRFVTWRITFIICVLCSIMIGYILFPEFPSEKNFLIMILILFTMITIVYGFYRFHMYDHISNHVNQLCEKIETSVKT